MSTAEGQEAGAFPVVSGLSVGSLTAPRAQEAGSSGGFMLSMGLLTAGVLWVCGVISMLVSFVSSLIATVLGETINMCCLSPLNICMSCLCSGQSGVISGILSAMIGGAISVCIGTFEACVVQLNSFCGTCFGGIWSCISSFLALGMALVVDFFELFITFMTSLLAAFAACAISDIVALFLDFMDTIVALIWGCIAPAWTLIADIIVLLISSCGTLITEILDLIAGGIEAFLSLFEALLFSCISWCASFVPLAIFDILWEIIDTACASLQDFVVFFMSAIGTTASMILSIIGTLCSSLLGCCGWCSFDIIWETIDAVIASAQDLCVFGMSTIGIASSMVLSFCGTLMAGFCGLCWGSIEAFLSFAEAFCAWFFSFCPSFVCGAFWDVALESVDTVCASAQDFLVLCASFWGTAITEIIDLIAGGLEAVASFLEACCASLFSCAFASVFDIIWELVDACMASMQDLIVWFVSACNAFLAGVCGSSVGICSGIIASCISLGGTAITESVDLMAGGIEALASCAGFCYLLFSGFDWAGYLAQACALCTWVYAPCAYLGSVFYLCALGGLYLTPLRWCLAPLHYQLGVLCQSVSDNCQNLTPL